MRIINLSLENPKFAFVLGNRAVDEKRLEETIRMAGRVEMPIYGAFYDDIKDSGIKVFDAITGELLDSPTEEYFVAFEGQHRTITGINLYNKKQEQLKNASNPDVSVINFADTIPAIVLDAEECKGVDFQKKIIELNATQKSWTSKDYAYSAHELKKGDDIVSFIYELSNMGFSISSISRILFFDHKVLNNKMLAEYSNGKCELPECNFKLKLELFRMLVDRGFSLKFLRKRYLYDVIIKKNNAQKFDEFVSSLSQLDETTVKQIEQLSPTDYDNGKISEIVNSFAANNDCLHENTPISFDLSENRFNENLKFVHLKFDESKNKHQKKKSKGLKKKLSKATKKEKSTNYTIDDIV